jgi:hypothetical protein
MALISLSRVFANMTSAVMSYLDDNFNAIVNQVNGNLDETNIKQLPNAIKTAAGNTIWHDGNDGSGSGLDAGLLEGHAASYFAVASAVSFTTQQVVTGSRAIDTTYQNTTGKPMMVTIVVYNNDSHAVNAITDSDDSPKTVIATSNSSNALDRMYFTFIVLNGNYYRLNKTGDSLQLSSWTEWY